MSLGKAGGFISAGGCRHIAGSDGATTAGVRIPMGPRKEIMLNKVLKFNDTVQKQWAGLTADWEMIEDKDDKHVFWSKKCGLFFVYVYKTGLNDYSVEFINADHKLMFEQKLAATNLEAAKSEANEAISEFVARGFEMGSGFSVGMERPHNEIRIMQAFTAPSKDGSMTAIMGVGEDGILYYFNGESWEPRSMKRAGAIR